MTERRLLVAFTGGALDPTVLSAAIRIARAESATLVPAYLLVIPRSLAEDAPATEEVAGAMPWLEAVELEALRAGVPVDARIEKGRTPTHALCRLWDVEPFDRVIARGPDGDAPAGSLRRTSPGSSRTPRSKLSSCGQALPGRPSSRSSPLAATVAETTALRPFRQAISMNPARSASTSARRPGVGKTFAMLNEGRRRKSRGTDVVVGFVETHGRPSTAEQIGDLEVVPRKVIEYKGATFEEMDVDAILARAPQVALVDELAHTNVPGSRNKKRCEDVQELLDAGITVISTLNIQHLESVNDVVEQITGVKQRETIPDAIVRRADQVELVDMAPEAIRRRMAHGNIYPPERVDAALGNYFRPGNLAALRELAFCGSRTGSKRGSPTTGTVTGSTAPGRRASGSSSRSRVGRRRPPDPPRCSDGGARRTGSSSPFTLRRSTVGSGLGAALERQKLLVEELGGTVKEVAGDDVGETLVAAAKSLNATQIVLGSTRRSRYARADARIRDQPGDSCLGDRDRRPRDQPGGARRADRAASSAAPPDGVAEREGWRWRSAARASACRSLRVLTPSFEPISASRASLLLYLLAVVLSRRSEGSGRHSRRPLAGFLLANYYFTPPLHTFTIAEGDNFVALVVFLAVAAVVSGFVALASRRAAEGARARAESEALVRLGGSSSIADLARDTAARARRSAACSLLHRAATGWESKRSAGSPIASADGPDAANHTRRPPRARSRRRRDRRPRSADSRRVRRRGRRRDRRSRSSLPRCAR